MSLKEILEENIGKRVLDSSTKKSKHEFTVRNKYGLHARPATGISNAVMKYEGEVIMTYYKNGEEIVIDPKSVLNLLSEGIESKTKVYFYFEDGAPSREILRLIEREMNFEYKV